MVEKSKNEFEENIERSDNYDIDDDHDSENCLDSHMTHHNKQQESLESYLEQQRRKRMIEIEKIRQSVPKTTDGSSLAQTNPKTSPSKAQAVKSKASPQE